MASSLGSLIIRLAADTGTFESDMGRAARVADQQSRAISRSLKTSSRGFSEVSRAFSALNMAGLNQLASSSTIATGALKGLAGAFALIGVVAWPVAVLAGAVMGLTELYSIMTSDVAAAQKLGQEADRLNQSLNPLSTESQLATNINDLTKAIDALDKRAANMRGLQSLFNKMSALPMIGPLMGLAGMGAGGLAGKEENQSLDSQLKVAQDKWNQVALDQKQTAQFLSQFQQTDALTKISNQLAEVNLKIREQQQLLGTANGNPDLYAQLLRDQTSLNEAWQSEAAKEAAKDYTDLAARADKLSNALNGVLQQQQQVNDLVKQGQVDYIAAQKSMADAAAAQNKSFMDLITPNAKLNDQIADVTAYAQQNPLSDTAKNLTAIIDKMRADFKSGTDSMNEYSKQAARNIQSVFADFLFEPFQDGLRGMLSGFINVIRRMVAEQLAAQILGGSDGKSGWLNTSLSFLFGSGHASGGAVSAGTLYPVNEGGPELLSTGGKDYLMMGGNGGFITPNTNIDTGPAGGGINLTTNIDARGAQDPGQMLAALQVWETKVKRDVITYSQRGYMPA